MKQRPERGVRMGERTDGCHRVIQLRTQHTLLQSRRFHMAHERTQRSMTCVRPSRRTWRASAQLDNTAKALRLLNAATARVCSVAVCCMYRYRGFGSRCFAQMNAMGRVLHLTQWAIVFHIFDEHHTKRHDDAGRSVVHQQRPQWQWPPPDGCQAAKPAPMHCKSCNTVLPPP